MPMNLIASGKLMPHLGGIEVSSRHFAILIAV